MKFIVASILVLMVADIAQAEMDATALWRKRCATCHGADGRGSAMMSKSLNVPPESLDLTKDSVRDMTDGEIIRIIRRGRGKMPGMSNIVYHKAQLEVVGYLRQLQSPP